MKSIRGKLNDKKENSKENINGFVEPCESRTNVMGAEIVNETKIDNINTGLNEYKR